MEENKLPTPIEFMTEVNTRFNSGKYDSLLEATASLFDDLDLESSEHLNLIPSVLMTEIKVECSKRNLLKVNDKSTNLVDLFA